MRAGDVDAMMADVADGVVMFDMVDPLWRDGKAASRTRAAAWVSYDGPIAWENRDVRFRIDHHYGVSRIPVGCASGDILACHLSAKPHILTPRRNSSILGSAP